MKHQLLSNEVLLPNEDLGAFADLENEFRAVLAPEGMLEAELVERIIALTWRLERMGKLESAFLIWQRFEVLGMNQVKPGHPRIFVQSLFLKLGSVAKMPTSSKPRQSACPSDSCSEPKNQNRGEHR
jgi:hypothetical protein